MPDEKPEEDWDFDFSQYGEEEEDFEMSDSITELKRPSWSALRSRFSNGEAILYKLANLENYISKYAIKVGTRTQNMADLWKLYAILDEYWDNIRHIYGEKINDEMNGVKKNCMNLMNLYTNKNIPNKVHNNLLYLKSLIYRVAQIANLRFEVERVGRGSFSTARRKITQ